MDALDRLHLGRHADGIRLQTRRGRDIPNVARASVDDGRLDSRFAILRERHPGILVRRGATALYNCFGHVWACRRTWVEVEGALLALQDDGYRPLGAKEAPNPGDLALYWLQPMRELTHVGMVLSVDQASGASAMIPVLSKLGEYGEVVHAAGHNLFPGCDYEFWTDRP